jgi:hypothetical protein
VNKAPRVLKTLFNADPKLQCNQKSTVIFGSKREIFFQELNHRKMGSCAKSGSKEHDENGTFDPENEHFDQSFFPGSNTQEPKYLVL